MSMRRVCTARLESILPRVIIDDLEGGRERRGSLEGGRIDARRAQPRVHRERLDGRQQSEDGEAAHLMAGLPKLPKARRPVSSAGEHRRDLVEADRSSP